MDKRTFTLITDVEESVHVSQHRSMSPEEALAQHISQLPFEDGAGPFDDDLVCLQGFAAGTSRPTLIAIAGCESTWTWLEGSRHSPPYATYVVCTDVAK